MGQNTQLEELLTVESKIIFLSSRLRNHKLSLKAYYKNINSISR